MNSIAKNAFSIVLSLALVVGLLPSAAYASPEDSGQQAEDGSVESSPSGSDTAVGEDQGIDESKTSTTEQSESGGATVDEGASAESNSAAVSTEDPAPEFDRAEIWSAGVDDASEAERIYSSEAGISTFSARASLRPMTFSSEMLYFCKYESSQNYDQGLSSGDGYHAMGYFQFDNRYCLGRFLKAVYNYNPSRYSCLKVIGDRYGWDVTGATRSNGAFTQLGNDLNNAWHAAYDANPTEFSQLQNGWAYIEYYDASDGVRGALMTMGIDIDNRPDCIKGLVWGMTNLFGKGGGASYIEDGYYYGANWFYKNSGINNSMGDEEFVRTLCTYVVNNVAKRYPNQTQYHKGWQNRYKKEMAECLSMVGESEQEFAGVYEYEYYLEKNPDVAAYYGDDRRGAFEHFLNYGMKEGRASAPGFDVASYYNANVDLRRAYGINDLSKYYRHYVEYGKNENRTCLGVGDLKSYVSTYGGVDYSPVYDGACYYGSYSDLRTAFTKKTSYVELVDDASLLRHFVRDGMREGRRACEGFDVHLYRNGNSDLERAFRGDLTSYFMHYLRYGQAEGRDGLGRSSSVG